MMKVFFPSDILKGFFFFLVALQYKGIRYILSSCDSSLKTCDNASHYGLKCLLLSITRDNNNEIVYFFFRQSPEQVNQQSQPSETQFILDSPYCKVETICYKAGNNSWQLPHYLEIPSWHIQGRIKIFRSTCSNGSSVRETSYSL